MSVGSRSDQVSPFYGLVGYLCWIGVSDIRYRGGAICSSDEAPVTSLERRVHMIRPGKRDQSFWEGGTLQDLANRFPLSRRWCGCIWRNQRKNQGSRSWPAKEFLYHLSARSQPESAYENTRAYPNLVVGWSCLAVQGGIISFHQFFIIEMVAILWSVSPNS